MSHSKETELLECVWWIISMTMFYTQIKLLESKNFRVILGGPYFWDGNGKSHLGTNSLAWMIIPRITQYASYPWRIVPNSFGYYIHVYDIYIYVSRYHRTSYHHQHFACSSFAGVASFTVQALGCHWERGVHWDCGWWATRASETTLSWGWFVRCYVRDYPSLNCIHNSSRSWFWKEDIWVTVTNQDFLWDGVLRSSL